MPAHIAELCIWILILSAVTGFVGFGIGWIVGKYKARMEQIDETKTSPVDKDNLVELRQEILKLREQFADLALSIDDRERALQQDASVLDASDEQ